MEVRSLTRSLSSLDLHLQSLVTGAVRVVVDVLDPCLPKEWKRKNQQKPWKHILTKRKLVGFFMFFRHDSAVLTILTHLLAPSSCEVGIIRGRLLPKSWRSAVFSTARWIQCRGTSRVLSTICMVSMCVNMCQLVSSIPCIPLHSIAFRHLTLWANLGSQQRCCLQKINGWPKTIKSRNTMRLDWIQPDECILPGISCAPPTQHTWTRVQVYVNIKRRGQVKPVELMQFPANSCGKVGFFTSSLVWC